jgi:hypothetical protein
MIATFIEPSFLKNFINILFVIWGKLCNNLDSVVKIQTSILGWAFEDIS